MMGSTGLPKLSIMDSMNWKVLRDTQPRCVLQSWQLRRAWCGPADAPSVTVAHPQLAQGRGMTTSRPTLDVEGMTAAGVGNKFN
jgi:hypothetical protein